MNVYGRLAGLCSELHRLLYVAHDRAAAVALLPQLKTLLARVPARSIAIVVAEARALREEICDNSARAIHYRQQEIALIERLWQDIETHNYDEGTRRVLLSRRDRGDVILRKRIIRTLQLKGAELARK